VATVRQWTGREAAALRKALRLSVRAYAEHLGVAPRTVSKWESGGSGIEPRPETQAILDTALGRADADTQTRFEQSLGREPAVTARLSRLPAEDYETWADDLERTIVNLSHQNFRAAAGLLNRWLTRCQPTSLDTRGLHLYARSLVLLADLRRDQGLLSGDGSARQTYHRALEVFDELAAPRRAAQIELSLAVVTEMSGYLGPAAGRYRRLAADERLSPRDRARAQLWVGTALSKGGHHAAATRAMLPALRSFESLDEQDDWSVAHQKLALAYRGDGDLNRASRHIGIALENGPAHAPMQQVRISTAHAHILLSDKATWDNGLSLLDQAAATSAQFGLAHQLASIGTIRHAFEQAADRLRSR
jgi:transcriptional regulator with XRE-family HTH domain